MRRLSARALQATWLTAVVMVTVGTGPASPSVAARGVARADGVSQAQRAAQVPGATISCGLTCKNLFSRKLGSSQMMTVLGPGGAGQELYLGPGLNAGVNGDFIATSVGRVFQFCGAAANDFFLSASYVCAHYPFSRVYELVWSPSGNESGLCAGVTQPGATGANVTLQPCGMHPATAWVFDPLHETPGTISCTAGTLPPVPPNGTGNFCPLVNGGDPESSDPLVLTVDIGTTGPANQLKVRHELLQGGVASADQQFAVFRGPAS